MSIGSQVAGQLFNAVGARTTFEIFGIGAFIVFVIHVCVQMYLQRNGTDENGKGRSSSASASAPGSETNNAIEADNTLSDKNTSKDQFTDVDLTSN